MAQVELIKASTIYLVLLVLLGCGNQASDQQHSDQQHSDQQHEDQFPYDYTINEVEDVIDLHGSVSNYMKLDDFIEGKMDSQRVVRYTIEGDPIYYQVTHRNDRIELRYDTTKDKFGSPNVTVYMCDTLQKEETDTEQTYTLTDCDGEPNEINILTKSYDVEAQDAFEFILKYGVNQKNEINTMDQKLVKDLQNGEVSEVSGFHFSKEERGLIFKKMVLSNYLKEKSLSNTCNQKPHVSYNLTIKINGGNRAYEWTECDKSTDGVAMTFLANEIINIVQAKDEYKRLPAVKGVYI